MLSSLLLSAICVNGVHGYLLWSQRNDRKWSLNVHAVASRKNYILYIGSHALGGLLFVLFAKEFFVTTHGASGLFYMAIVNYVLEVTQALLPSKGRWEKSHSIIALLMWFCFLTIGLVSIVILDVDTLYRTIAAVCFAVIFSMVIRAYFRRSKLYFYQMSMILLFFVAMLSLAMGS